MDLTEINTFWRQIRRAHTHACDTNTSRTRTPGILSYTAGEVARNEPHDAGNKVVVWIYWKNNHTKEDRERWRAKCEGHSGLTINGDELLVMERAKLEELAQEEVLLIIGVYDLNLFEYGNKEIYQSANKGDKGDQPTLSKLRTAGRVKVGL